MSVLIAALLYVPGIVVGSVIWKRLARPTSSLVYSSVAAAASISGFLAAESLIAFIVSRFTSSANCLEATDCQVQALGDAFRWWFLGLSFLFGALTYLAFRYCARIALRK
jgi:hypothetical protein